MLAKSTTRKYATCVLILLCLTLPVAGQNSWEEKNQTGEKAFREGKLADANRLFVEALHDAQQFGEKDVRLAPIYNNLALVAFVRNNFIASEEMYEKAISVVEGARGPEDPLLLPILENLTRLYVKQWSFNQAIHTSKRICSIREKSSGAQSPETASSLNQLATLYLESVQLLPHADSASSSTNKTAEDADGIPADDSARLAIAEELYRRALAVQEKIYGAGNSRLVEVLENLGEVQHAEGEMSQAGQSYEAAAHIIEVSFGREDLKLAGPLQHMADLKAEQEDYPAAEELYKRALQIREKRLGENDPAIVSLLTSYAVALEKNHKPDEAKKLSDRAAALNSSRKTQELKLASQVNGSPYVIRFERAIYDRYSGVQQTCMLVRADGRVHIEEQQGNGRPGSSMALERSPDGMASSPAVQERLAMPNTNARPPKVFDSFVDNDSLQQLRALLSAKEVRSIQGNFPASRDVNYYGTEAVSVSVLRDDTVQNFAFPDMQARQAHEETLRPLFKWMNNAEKHKGSPTKGAVANSCSPDLPSTVPSQFGASRGVITAKTSTGNSSGNTISKDSPETASTIPETTIKVAVNLVLVRVVVRDQHGNAVSNLRQEDFQLLDNKKPRTITRFSLEQNTSNSSGPQSSSAANSPVTASGMERSIAYLFDDIHLNKGDLARVQTAADHQISSLDPSARLAVFTTSGHNTLDFTTDRAKLRETVMQINPRKVQDAGGNNCPDIDTYMADLIWNKKDEEALGAATEQTIECAFAGNVRAGAAAEAMARSTAQQQFLAAESDSQTVLLALQGALRKLAVAPGQRSLVMISPGFIAPGREQDFAKLMDGALHADIVISTLDTRGLYNIDSVGSKSRAGTEYKRQAASAAAELLTTLADSTGGTFFHNNNDIDAGIGQVSRTAESSYIIGFSPSQEELDGHFHALEVKVTQKEKLSVQARKGYYATPHSAKGS